jgi:four helix bundle protein
MASGENGAGTVLNYKDLLIWQKGMRLTKMIYQLTGAFPTEEKYGLGLQMRRAAVSIPSNVAEGQARRGSREFPHFLSLACGSLAELDTQLLLSSELGYAGPEETAGEAKEIVELQKMSAAIQRKLGERMRRSDERLDG